MLVLHTALRRNHRHGAAIRVNASLCRSGWSPVAALASADSRREVVPGLRRLPRLTLSRHVRFTDSFTNPFLTCGFLSFQDSRPRTFRPAGPSGHRRPTRTESGPDSGSRWSALSCRDLLPRVSAAQGLRGPSHRGATSRYFRSSLARWG